MQTGQKMEIKLTTISSKGKIHSTRTKILTTVTVSAPPEEGALVCPSHTHKDQLNRSLGRDLSFMILLSQTDDKAHGNYRENFQKCLVMIWVCFYWKYNFITDFNGRGTVPRSSPLKSSSLCKCSDLNISLQKCFTEFQHNKCCRGWLNTSPEAAFPKKETQQEFCCGSVSPRTGAESQSCSPRYSSTPTNRWIDVLASNTDLSNILLCVYVVHYGPLTSLCLEEPVVSKTQPKC